MRSMKRCSAVLIVALLAVTGCTTLAGWHSQASGIPGPARIERFDELSFERTSCYGTCPTYSVTIFGDGRVVFDGKRYVKAQGRVTDMLSGAQMEELVTAINGADFFSLRDRYERVKDGCPTTWTDFSSVITRVKVGDRVKTIRHNLGCREEDDGDEVGAAYPKALTDFEDRLDEIVGTARWVGDEVHRRAGPLCTGIAADRVEVTVGDSVGLMANASDPDGNVLVYTWSATGGRVVGSGANVTFDTTGLAEGAYTVAAQVDDGFGHVVDCSVSIAVKPRPNQCPDITLTADKVSVESGEIVTFTATAPDPDNGPGPVKYTWSFREGSAWRTPHGPLRASGSTAILDTTGLKGTLTVTVSTNDGDPACTDTESTTISAKVVTLTACPMLSDLYFPLNKARISNEHKAILDDIALRMQKDPRLVAVIDGHSGTGERAGIARKRAENSRAYLVNEMGIAANRIVVRSFDGKCPMADEKQNRRVEFYLLPEGRAVEHIEKNCGGAEPEDETR